MKFKLVGLVCLTLGLNATLVMAQERSSLCRFTSGPRTGQIEDWSRLTAPNPVGAACNDLAGSTGVFVARNRPVETTRGSGAQRGELSGRVVRSPRNPASADFGAGTARAWSDTEGPGMSAWGPGIHEKSPEARAQRNFEARVDRHLDRIDQTQGNAARLREENRLRRAAEIGERERQATTRKAEQEARDWLRAREALERDQALQRSRLEERQRAIERKQQAEVERQQRVHEKMQQASDRGRVKGSEMRNREVDKPKAERPQIERVSREVDRPRRDVERPKREVR